MTVWNINQWRPVLEILWPSYDFSFHSLLFSGWVKLSLLCFKSSHTEADDMNVMQIRSSECSSYHQKANVTEYRYLISEYLPHQPALCLYHACFYLSNFAWVVIWHHCLYCGITNWWTCALNYNFRFESFNYCLAAHHLQYEDLLHFSVSYYHKPKFIEVWMDCDGHFIMFD